MNVEDNNAKSIPDVNTYEVLVTWNSGKNQGVARNLQEY